MKEFFLGLVDTLIIICMLMVVIPVQVVALIASNVGDFLCRLLEEVRDFSVRVVEHGQNQAKQKN